MPWHQVGPNGVMPNAIDKYPHLPGFTYANPHTGEQIVVTSAVCCCFPSDRIVVQSDNGTRWSVAADRLDRIYQEAL